MMPPTCPPGDDAYGACGDGPIANRTERGERGVERGDSGGDPGAIGVSSECNRGAIGVQSECNRSVIGVQSAYDEGNSIADLMEAGEPSESRPSPGTPRERS